MSVCHLSPRSGRARFTAPIARAGRGRNDQPAAFLAVFFGAVLFGAAFFAIAFLEGAFFAGALLPGPCFDAAFAAASFFAAGALRFFLPPPNSARAARSA